MFSYFKKRYEKSLDLLARLYYFRNEIGYHPFSTITLNLDSYYDSGSQIHEGDIIRLFGKFHKPNERAHNFILGKNLRLLFAKLIKV